MKSRILVLALALGSAIAPLSASAQAFEGNMGGGSNLCSLNIFVSSPAAKCSGFYEMNSNAGSTGGSYSADHVAALADFGLPTTGVIVEKINFADGSAGIFATPLTGPFVIGFHWGNYAGEPGNVSAFYQFNAGQSYTGLAAGFRTGLSNGVILRNGGTVVPEPSTYALMAAGLAGLGLVARRRRNT